MKYLLLAFLLFSLTVTAQVNEKELKENMAKLDSSTAALNESIARSMHANDSIEMARTNEQMARNMSSFMASRKEQERKQTQQMYFRLAFGGAMLVVLVVGLLRKKKPKV